MALGIGSEAIHFVYCIAGGPKPIIPLAGAQLPTVG
jgi:hypothetical protein